MTLHAALSCTHCPLGNLSQEYRPHIYVHPDTFYHLRFETSFVSCRSCSKDSDAQQRALNVFYCATGLTPSTRPWAAAHVVRVTARKIMGIPVQHRDTVTIDSPSLEGLWSFLRSRVRWCGRLRNRISVSSSILLWAKEEKTRELCCFPVTGSQNMSADNYTRYFSVNLSYHTI